MNPVWTLRQHCESALEGLRIDRYSWWLHWLEIANVILPRRYTWLVTPNQYNRGSPINGAILDSTATQAARNMAAGMMSGLVSPTRPWFKLEVEGFDRNTTNPVSLWLADTEKRMMKVFQRSNFYNAMGILFMDLGVFGTAPMYIYDDPATVIRCYNPCAGEYYVANSDRLAINVIYREFVQTVRQLVQWFGLENVSEGVKKLYATGGAGLSKEIKVAHAVEPNTPTSGVPEAFPWREVYWEVGSAAYNKTTETELVLQKNGYFEFPAICPRWDISGNDSYGRSPAMDALPDTRQLQQETKRKAQAIDKMVNPPLLADVELKNQPISMLPGGVTYVARMGNERVGMRPVYQVNPQLGEMMQDIAEIQTRIKSIFFNDLFLMISQLDTVRSATEIDARKEEKLIMLGPVLERFFNEGLDPTVNRTFNIMWRRQLLSPPPKELQGATVEIQYVSTLAEAQRAVKASGIERTLAVAGNLAGIDPEVMDKIDIDRTVERYGSFMGMDPDLIRSDEEVAKIREARQKQKNAETAAAGAMAAVDGAKTLSDTKLGGGQSALDAMLQGSTIQ